jgi:hypothetical protein
VKDFYEGNTDADGHEVIEDPVFVEKTTNPKGDGKAETDDIAPSHKLEYSILQFFEEVKYLVKAQEHARNGNYDTKYSDEVETNVRFFRGKFEENDNGYISSNAKNQERNPSHLKPKRLKVNFNRPGVRMHSHPNDNGSINAGQHQIPNLKLFVSLIWIAVE